MNRMISYRPWSTDLAALLLRLLVGGLFINHGWDKIVNYDKYLAMFQETLGLGAKLEYNLLIFGEFVCGILVVLGFLTRLTILPIIFSMCIAYFITLKKSTFYEKEIVFLFIGLGVIIFILGSGSISVDRLLQKRKPSQL